jgi:small-conductance mechanosensitive channel/CRP-like cAMP-binding protein
VAKVPAQLWTLLVVVVAGAVALARWTPVDRRRISAIWAFAGLAVLTFAISLAPTLEPRQRLVAAETARAFSEIAAIQFASLLLIQVILRRFALPRIASDLFAGLGYLLVLLNLLARLGVNVTGLIATSAVFTAVVGFGLQDLLGNLVGGLSLQIERSIRQGDWIKTDLGVGQVRMVRIRHTALETPDGDTILLPNSMLTKQPVTVFGRLPGGTTLSPSHRKLITFPVEYRHSPARVIEVVEEALSSSPIEGMSETPAPRCLIVEYRSLDVLYGVLVWLTRPAQEYVDASVVRTRIYYALTRIGIPLASIPQSVNLEDTRGAAQGRLDEERGGRQTLNRIPIFQSLTGDENRAVWNMLERLRFAPGEYILHQGDEGDSLYILERGKVKITLKNGNGAREIAVLHPGQFFGEMSLLTGERRSANVIAAEEVECHRLKKDDFRKVLDRRHELAEEISLVLAARQSSLETARRTIAEESQSISHDHDQELLARIRRFFGLTGFSDKT